MTGTQSVLEELLRLTEEKSVASDHLSGCANNSFSEHCVKILAMESIFEFFFQEQRSFKKIKRYDKTVEFRGKITQSHLNSVL